MGVVLEYAKKRMDAGGRGWKREVWEEMVGADVALEQYRENKKNKTKQKK
jgi:hypothetical protein